MTTVRCAAVLVCSGFVALVPLRAQESPVIARPSGADSVVAGYDVFAHQERAMNVLLGWGGGSIVTGSLMLTTGSRLARDFGIQNIAWGAIDGAIALWAKGDIATKRLDGTNAAEERASFRRILLINTVLDLAYIVTGLFLSASGKEWLIGHGRGILVQGSFLFLFDGINFLLTAG